MRDLNDGDPRVVGDYRLIGQLGSGGMGVVYLGQDPAGELAAIKVVHEALSRQPEFRVRFQREVRAMGQVQGPFTARVLGSSVDAVQPWVAMEYVPGPTLDAAITATGPLPADQVRAFATGLAGGIESLHRAGIIHRDLKPGNVILSPDGPRIVDLGVAHAIGATALTVTGQRIGTFAWMAPEQLDGHPETAATDMFAWGCLVCLAATGAHPYGTGRPEAIAVRIMTSAPNLTGIHHLDADLVAAVSATLDRNPQARPTAASVLATATGAVGSQDTVIDQAATIVHSTWAPTVAPSDPTQLIARAAPVNGTPPGNADPGPRQRKRRAAALLTALAGLVLLGVGAAAALGLIGAPTAAENAPTPPEASAPPTPNASATRASSPTPEASPPSEPAPSPSQPSVITFKSTPDMTLDGAIAAAEDFSCNGCVDLSYDPAASEESASRGLVELGVSDPGGGGAMTAWGYTGATWAPLMGYQASVPLPVRLPAAIWICTDESSTNIRSGPGTNYPVIDTVKKDRLVDASFMRLTEPQTFDQDGIPVEGQGWFEISSGDLRGWVSSKRVANSDNLDVAARGCDGTYGA